MKGLLLQDYYVMKKNLLISLFICFYFFIVMMIGSSDSKSSEINMVIYLLFALIPCFFTTCACFTIQNKSTKSALFARTYPIPSHVVTLEKYILTYALLLGSCVVLLLFIGINSLVNDYTPTKTVAYTCFLILSVIFLFINLELPITMRFGQAVASAILIAFIFLMVIIGVSVVVKVNLSPDLSESLHSLLRKKWVILLVVSILDILSMFASYFLARRLNTEN